MLYSSTPCIRMPSPARHIEELYSPFDLLESDMLNPLHELRASVIIGNNHHPRLQVLKLEASGIFCQPDAGNEHARDLITTLPGA